MDYFLNLSSIILTDELLLDEVDWDAYDQITNSLREEGFDTEQLMAQVMKLIVSMI